MPPPLTPRLSTALEQLRIEVHRRLGSLNGITVRREWLHQRVVVFRRSDGAIQDEIKEIEQEWSTSTGVTGWLMKRLRFGFSRNLTIRTRTFFDRDSQT